MIELPPTLAPWGQQLALFPVDVAVSLGRWLPRIDAVVGPLRNTEIEDGDPDGFDGLSRRGSYDRLLVSEWLLAEEAPDEFVRRAANGEHAFLRLGRHSPASAARCVVLLDAGWQQLGAPRLAHMALLVALARRAMAAGVDFAWGVVQEPAELRDGLSKPGVRALINARTAVSATAEHMDRWWRCIEPKAEDDLWVVGGNDAGVLAKMRDIASIEVCEDVSPGPRRLCLEVRGRRQLSRRAQLELPTEAASVRVLRHPFPTPQEPLPAKWVPRFRDGTELLLVPGPRRLIGYDEEGLLVAAHIPTSKGEKPGRTRRFTNSGGERIIGTTYLRKNLIVLTAKQGTFKLYRRSGGSMAGTYAAVDDGRRFVLGEGQDRLRPMRVLRDERGGEYVALIDDADNLFAFPIAWGETTREYERRHTGVVAMSAYGQCLGLVRDSGNTLRVIGLSGTAPDRTHSFLQQAWSGRAVFGPADFSDRFALALEYETNWVVATEHATHLVLPPPGAVLGVFGDTRMGIGLIVHDAARRELLHVGPNGTHTITCLERPARSPTMNGSLVGWIDDGGVPQVWCLKRAEGVLNLAGRNRW